MTRCFDCEYTSQAFPRPANVELPFLDGIAIAAVDVGAVFCYVGSFEIKLGTMSGKYAWMRWNQEARD